MTQFFRKNKIVFFSSGRSDYDLIKNLVNFFSRDANFITYLLVTGTHTSNIYGNTKDYILPNKSIIFETIKVRHINNSPKDIIISSKEYLLKIQNLLIVYILIFLSFRRQV